jgi:mono/diheme cytochrome c family protein/glucose/arabinose dehydrogenase
MKRALLLLLVLFAGGAVLWLAFRDPSPDEILASLEIPPSPVLSPEAERETFRTAPGFRVELVASEPLVVDPVAMDWDDRGRLYVVEMRGYMPNLDGEGEDAPVGRVVILEDNDLDGRMDTSRVFLDGLVLPRAIAVLPEGVLIGEPPDLWLCEVDEEDRCARRRRVGSYAEGRSNPEHQENGLLPALDNWIYNARSDRRMRIADGELVVEATPYRGQFGIAQDDQGRFFYNHNSGFLYADEIPADYFLRQSQAATAGTLEGVNESLATDEEVHGVRLAAGLNRAYVAGTLRPDGRQRIPTGVSGVGILRGDQFGPGWVGDAFVPESAGSVVAHFRIEEDGLDLRAEHVLYEDPQWGRREFLASTDERFRPVDARTGPDGSLWVIDMYRGVIQHAQFVSDHLREYVKSHDLEPPGETGRIWRIVREGREIARTPPPLETIEDLLEALDAPNGWVRDRAQRRLVATAPPDAVAALRRLRDFGANGRRHALWTLRGSGHLDVATWRRAIDDPDPAVRVAALRAGESLFSSEGASSGGADAPTVREIVAKLDDADASVRIQALLSLSRVPTDRRPIERILALGRDGDALTRQGALAALADREREALAMENDRLGDQLAEAERTWLESLAATAQLGVATAEDPATAGATLLDLVAATPEGDRRKALLAGIRTAQRSPAMGRVELAMAHPLFAEEEIRLETGVEEIRRGFTWPGDPRPGGARLLTVAEEERRAAGEVLYADTCAACHGVDGRGIAGQAPALAGSPWVRNSDDWLVRIVLQGMTGPVEIDGHEWDLTMPGHGDDAAHFGDEEVAGLLTFLRRAWGHGDDPVDLVTVARIRAETTDRRAPWTVAELRGLEVRHRLDRYAGVYTVPLVGAELIVERQEDRLAVGRRDTGLAEMREAGDGLFISPAVTVQFEEGDASVVEGARIVYGGMNIALAKEE